ncbi:macro domain-containing protein, partial [bacterium]|nr:macro domain-containing protein [bacterium]
MVQVLIGDLFKSQAQTLVNTVNCVGIMGKGVALEFKKRFPDMFKDYAALCAQDKVRLRRPYLFRNLLSPWILNFPTKDHWRSLTKLKDIEAGLEYLLQNYREWGVTSLAVPPLGCGHGQLEWRIVAPTLFRCLQRLEIPVELYAPYGTPHKELEPQFLNDENHNLPNEQTMPNSQWVKPAWIALVEILKRIEDQPYHWPIGRTTFQKIAFIATEQG